MIFWALWTSRSSIASASVGSPIHAGSTLYEQICCQRIDTRATPPALSDLAAAYSAQEHNYEYVPRHIFRHDDGGYALEVLERLDVQQEPGLDLLIEADPRELMARVAQHHDKHARFTQSTFGRIVEVADVSKVDLCFLSGIGLQGDRDVLRAEPRSRRIDEHRRLTADTLPQNSECSWRSRS